MGIRGKISRSTLADANEKKDWRIYADFAQVLISTARDLYVDDDFGVELEETVYALDASTIDLCLSLFPWARFRKTKGAIKLHTLLDLRGNIPTFISITDGKVHEVTILDDLIPEPGAFYIMDRGYLDFERLYVLNQCMAFFIIRSKRNTKFRRLYSRTIDKSTGLRCNQTIVLSGLKTQKRYPEKIRRVRYFDARTDKRFSFLTNNFVMPAFAISELYRCRWQVGLFFKWIKQHLRIKSFYGTSANTVKTQIWIAVSVYVLVAIVKNHGVKISMDGRGRCQDNIFIERLWWTIKHHYLYLHSFGGGSDLRQGLSRWIRYYNQERGHSSLDDRTPDEAYYELPHPFAEAA